MNFLSIFTALASLYDHLATGGAKTEADKLLGVVVPVLTAAAPPAGGTLNAGTILTGAATIYSALATGGAATEAQQVLGIVTPLLGAVTESPVEPTPIIPGAEPGGTD